MQQRKAIKHAWKDKSKKFRDIKNAKQYVARSHTMNMKSWLTHEVNCFICFESIWAAYS